MKNRDEKINYKKLWYELREKLENNELYLERNHVIVKNMDNLIKKEHIFLHCENCDHEMFLEDYSILEKLEGYEMICTQCILNSRKKENKNEN